MLSNATNAIQNYTDVFNALAINASNANTTAYKSTTPQFQSGPTQYFEIPNQNGSIQQNGIYAQGTAERIANQTDLSQGPLTATNDKLNFAISGNGFFGVTNNGETYYTRAGQFAINATTQQLVCLSNGYTLAQNITIPQGYQSISLAEDGTVNVQMDEKSLPIAVGQIRLFGFINPQGLRSVGGGLFMATDASGNPLESEVGKNGLGTLKQGMIELSNVNMINIITGSVQNQSNFTLSALLFKNAKEMYDATEKMFA